MMRSSVLGLAGVALSLALGGGCSTAVVDDDRDAGADAAGAPDAAAQQDAPSFFEDASPTDDGGGATDSGGATGDGGGICYPEPDETMGGDACADALDRGSLSFSATNHITISGNLWPDGDVDWYTIAFVDAPTPADCGKFQASIGFAQNPGDHFRFEVMLDECSTQATCLTGDQTAGLTSFTLDGLPACPCVAPGGPPSPTRDGVHLCNDYSVTVRVRVFRAAGAPVVCENYELSIDNG